MKNCTLTITFNNKSNQAETINLEFQSDQIPVITDSSLVELLKNNPETYEQIKLYVENQYSQRLYAITPDILKQSGLVGTHTLADLKSLFPEIQFPENITANILLADNCKLGNSITLGKTKGADGNDLFIIDKRQSKEGVYTQVQTLADFLNIKVQLDNNRFGDSWKYTEDLKRIAEQHGYKENIAQLVIDFLSDKSEFSNLFYTNSKGKTSSVYQTLDEIGRELRGFEKRKEYNNPFINAISKVTKFEGNKDGITTMSLSLETLYNFINNLTDFKFESFDDFKKALKEKDNTGKTLLEQLLELNDAFNYKVSSISKNNIYLKQYHPTYDTEFGYNDNIKFTYQGQYKGYNLYKTNNGKWFYSFGYISSDTGITKSNSKEELISLIDNKDRSLFNESLLPFKFGNKFEILTNSTYKKHQLFDVLDIELDPNTKLNKKEKEFVSNKGKKMSDFYKYIDESDYQYKEEIKQQLDTPEKIVTFIYLAADKKYSIQEILNMINDAKTVSYYIEDTITNGYKIIPTDSVNYSELTLNTNKPVLGLLLSMQKAFNDKFGEGFVKLVTADEITDSRIDPNTDKAFILDGQIYVNSTIASGSDMLHEYVHLILGILRTENPKAYEDLINQVWDKSSEESKIHILNKYSNEPNQMIIREELFVNRFSKYMYGNISGDIFETNDAFKKVIMSNFKISSGQSVKDDCNTPIGQLFKVFETVNEGGWNFKRDSIQITNYISQQIEKNEIEQICK